MKMVIASSQFTPVVGGVPTVVTLLARELVKIGCEIKVVTTTPAQQIDSFGYEVIRQPKCGELLNLYRWADVSLQVGSSINLGWPVFMLRKPFFIVHQTWIGESGRFPALTKRLRLGLLKRCNNLSISASIASSLPVPSKIIPNPFDDELFKLMPKIRRDKDLVFLGRLEEEKGVGDLIESLGILKRNGCEVTLTIIGYGTLRDELEAKTREMGLAHLVIFFGEATPGEELTVLLNRHKIIVVPSRWNEPFGIVALEGIACGCVVIGSSGGGLPEAIGPCGVTFKNGHVQALADTIRKLLDGSVELDQYRESAQRHLAQYHASAVAKKYMEIIKTHRVLISGGLTVGGPQTHVSILCRVLIEAGAEVTVAAAATNWSSGAINSLRALGVHIVVSSFGFGKLRLLGKAKAFVTWPFLLRHDYDVLYCIGEGRIHHWTSRFVKKDGLKIYHEIVECPAPNSVATKVAARMDGIIANSSRVRDQIARLLPGVPVRSIPFFTSISAMPSPEKRVIVKGQTLRVAYLGRLVSHKQPDRLIESWMDWRNRPPIGPARLDLYGGDYDSAMLARLKARVKELGMEDCVRLHGSYTNADLPGIFAATDLVVLPSLYEGLPLVLVESMLRGVPFVATAAGGTAELEQDNPDVKVTDTEWGAFEAGLAELAARLRAGQVDAVRLHGWAEPRYGFERVARQWRAALLDGRAFFGLRKC